MIPTTISNGSLKVPILEGATYIYSPQLSKSKQNRNRLFELTTYNENGKSDIYWLDTRRSSKAEMNKAILYDYLPTADENIKVSIIPLYDDCWKCHKNTTVIAGVLLECQNGKYSEFFDFPLLFDIFLEISDFIKCSKTHNIGEIKKRYSKTVQDSYLSNGCNSCDAIYGNFYLREELLEFQIHDELPESICSVMITFTELQKYLDTPLFFKELDRKEKTSLVEDDVYEHDTKCTDLHSEKFIEIIEEYHVSEDDINEIILQMLLDKRSLTNKQTNVIGRMKYFYIYSTYNVNKENSSDKFSVLHEEENFQLVSYKKELLAIANVEPYFVAYTYLYDKFVKIATNRFKEGIITSIIQHIDEQVNMF